MPLVLLVSLVSLVSAIAQELFTAGTYDYLVPATDPPPNLNELLA